MHILLVGILVLSGVVAGCERRDGGGLQQPTGVIETVFTAGAQPDNPFFRELGTNQRTCATCHDAEAGWSVTPSALQVRFDASDGLDAIFRAVDGATAPDADVLTLEARRVAYRLLLSSGLIRVGQPIPAGAEFTLSAVADPYGFASATELSLFRRPLPATNLRFVPEVMWDGREPSLTSQAGHATMGHAQATTSPEGIAGLAEIVAFESSLFTAQGFDDVAGDLAADGALGGPRVLATQGFAVGVNDSQSPGFDRHTFTLFTAWASADTGTAQGRRRAAIARGEQLFATRTFDIRNVAGLANQRGTCSTCHDTPNVGSHSVALPLDLGISDAGRRPSGFPLYTLQHLTTGATRRTTDPGLALVTGKWADIGRFKVPALRGLAARPPYFHNGFADDLRDVVRFYRRRFDVRLSERDEDDLVAFLSAL